MSDLAAPMLVVMKDEAEAFWCFAALMDRLEGNFHSDSQGMHAQLSALRDLIHLLDPPLHAHLASADALSFFFAYRWLLIHFKREFAFDEVSIWYFGQERAFDNVVPQDPHFSNAGCSSIASVILSLTRRGIPHTHCLSFVVIQVAQQAYALSFVFAYR